VIVRNTAMPKVHAAELNTNGTILRLAKIDSDLFETACVFLADIFDLPALSLRL
jgi:hypothetical protein